MLYVKHFTVFVAATLLLGTEAVTSPGQTKADLLSGLPPEIKKMLEQDVTEADISSNLPDELRQLLKQTFSSDARQRGLAAEKIGQMRDRGVPAIPFLIYLLYDNGSYHNLPENNGERNTPLEYVESKAADALVSIGEPAVAPLIAATKTPMRERNWAAISCLAKFRNSSGRFTNAQALGTLLKFLKSPDSETRRRVVIALNGCTDPRATLPLIEAIEDRNSEVQQFAARCFVTLRDPRTVEPLLRLVESKNIGEEVWGGDVRRAAITALGYQQDRRAAPALQKILQDPSKNKYDRSAAALALGRIGDASVFPALAKAFWDRNVPIETRAGAVHAVAMFRGDKNVGGMLGNLFCDEGSPFELQIEIVKAMSEYGDPNLVNALLGIRDYNGRNKLAFWAAMSAVKLSDGAIGDMGVVRVIQEYKEYDDGDEMYVKEKRDAIQKIADRGTTWRVRFAAKGVEWLAIAIPIGIVGAAISVAVACLIIRKRRKEPKTNAVSEARPENREKGNTGSPQ